MARDLSTRATLEDLTSAEGVAAFRGFLDGARSRIAGKVKILHVLERPDGTLLDLDFGIAAPDMDTLVAGCSGALLRLARTAIVELQPESDWWAFWTAPLKSFQRAWCKTHNKEWIWVVVHGGIWP